MNQKKKQVLEDGIPDDLLQLIEKREGERRTESSSEDFATQNEAQSENTQDRRVQQDRRKGN